MIQKILGENPESVKDYQEGRDRALKFLMGQVMKETKGCVDARRANEILQQELKNTRS